MHWDTKGVKEAAVKRINESFEPFGPITRLTARLNHFSCLPLKLHTLFGHQNEEDPGDFMSWKFEFFGLRAPVSSFHWSDVAPSANLYPSAMKWV